MALDLNDSYKKAKSRVSATQIVVETKKKELELKKKQAKSSLDENIKKTKKQLNEIEGRVKNLKNEIKSDVKNQLEQLLDLFKQSLPKTENKSLSTIVRFFIEAANNTKEKMKEELVSEIVSTIGCSEDQSYSDVVAGAGQSIYIKVSQVDLFKILQLSP
jgi:seryl-tRNA synthetase